jgi:tetratricopeptide (TPR) repeat protein
MRSNITTRARATSRSWWRCLSTRVTLASDEQQIIALHMRIGLLCEEGLRDHDRAISAYRHVVEAQPTHREALDAMARLLEANERWTELVEVTRRQIRLVTDRQHKALLYFKCGSVTEAKFAKEDEAIRYYEAAVRTSAACLPALHSLRDIYVRREDYAHVTQTLELESKLWTEPKEQAGILAHIGQIYLDKLHQAERAIEYYERALTVDKDCLPAHRALFHVYYQRGDFYRTYQTGQVLAGCERLVRVSRRSARPSTPSAPMPRRKSASCASRASRWCWRWRSGRRTWRRSALLVSAVSVA